VSVYVSVYVCLCQYMRTHLFTCVFVCVFMHLYVSVCVRCYESESLSVWQRAVSETVSESESTYVCNFADGLEAF